MQYDINILSQRKKNIKSAHNESVIYTAAPKDLQTPRQRDAIHGEGDLLKANYLLLGGQIN